MSKLEPGVTSSSYIVDGRIMWGAIATTLVSSYILVFFDGLSSLVSAIFEVPADLHEDFLSWIGETLGLGFSVPADSLEEAWTVAEEFFPIGGPFDWVAGVLLVMAFFVSVQWMVGRVKEGL